MRQYFVLPLALLFIALDVPSNAQSETTTAATLREVFYYDLGRPFALNCSLAAAADPFTYVWKKNGTSLEQVAALVMRYRLEEGGAVLRLLSRGMEDDYGNYSCEVAGTELVWDVRGRPRARIPHNVDVVEKQPLKIVCKMVGKPYAAVSWTFTNDSLTGTALEALGERLALRRSEQGVEGGELVLAAAERSDAGLYGCVPAGGGAPAYTTLHVKDQFTAEWPFLSFCADVFVLCTETIRTLVERISKGVF